MTGYISLQLINVNNLLAFTQSFYYLLIPNMYYISLTPCINYRAKFGNNVSEFTYSNWITQSYYSSPLHRYLIHFSDYDLEHGLAIVTESFSPLNLNYRPSFVKVQIRSDMPSHTISDAVSLPHVLNWAILV